MIEGILIGAGAILAIGFLVSLFDPDAREVLAGAVVALLIGSLILPYHGVRWLLRRDTKLRYLDNRTLTRFVNSNAYRGVVVHRRGRAYLVLTDPKVRKVKDRRD